MNWVSTAPQTLIQNQGQMCLRIFLDFRKEMYVYVVYYITLLGKSGAAPIRKHINEQFAVK